MSYPDYPRKEARRARRDADLFRDRKSAGGLRFPVQSKDAAPACIKIFLGIPEGTLRKKISRGGSPAP